MAQLPKLLLSYGEAAQVLGLGDFVFMELIRSGKIPVRRVTDTLQKVSIFDLEEFAEKLTQVPLSTLLLPRVQNRAIDRDLSRPAPVKPRQHRFNSNPKG